MNKYELAVVVSAKIEDEERAAVVDKCKIQKMKEGFYYFIQFEAESSAPAEIESRIRIMDNVLRYLVVKNETK